MSIEVTAISSLSRPSKRLAEVYLWILFAVLVGGRMILQFTLNPRSYFDIESIQFFYYDILAMAFVMLFPMLFSQIFGKLPFEYLRYKRALNLLQKEQSVNVGEIYQEAKEVIEQQVSANDSALQQMQKLAKSSKEISEGLYTRAGVYLFIGVIIAFSGLAFFYIETAKDVVIPQSKLDISSSSSSNVMLMAPKFGILFFIEMVAFFFLRQYREAMDEYRYYESIKRKREENLVLMQLNSEHDEPMSISELLEKAAFYSEHKNLKAGESTEIIESRKLSSNEIALMEKMLATMTSKK
ncbi:MULTISPECIES: hypothetical protein [unclassified Shewanella]|uniref:hypothetical protein n=1 Tax=unclassified Shewanella TaxID=196818 RepID=UPI001BB95118|nr:MULTISPECIES: hypothetical protein [unclassified Shewanella]GIU16236.1 hypothetical protein TUM4444_28740 [Shewanella sp. MBTL60-112-B1]GIU39243.1 hypothetical protein TUM4445_35110 [Shewanella sp. MBTL60-112-B2]